MFLRPPRDPDDPSLWRDLKNGDAGWVPRIGLSLATAGAVFAASFFLIGLFDATVGLDDAHIALGMGFGGVIWCGCLVFIWATFSRWWRLLKTIFCILGIWILAIPAAVFVDDMMRPAEFFIAAIFTSALGATLFLLFTFSYRRGGGKALVLRDGVIDVRCPECGYCLVGLSQCVCPECGAALTIDELIRRQNYRATAGVVRILPAGEPNVADDPPRVALPLDPADPADGVPGVPATD